MINGTSIKQRDIILIPFPYSDLNGIKKRPALILSGKDYLSKNNDVICCAMTSSPKNFDRGVMITNIDLDLGHLDFDTAVIPCKLFNSHKHMIIKHIGRLNIKKSKEVVEFLKVNIKIDE
ncbi:MAG: type II toxin-antitoxin system PemK/MazF family toxin [Candidatus Pacearchaeota archaeon]|nr:type II toxin-antitoxin system PemK/MazF family toxin [Candidatus Pacearchaeota archaeon]